MVTYTSNLYKSKRPERISFGNKRLLIYDINNAAAAATASTFPAFNRIEAVHAVNNTDSSDTFMETIGSHGGTTKNQVTLDPVTALDDGHIWIIGR